MSTQLALPLVHPGHTDLLWNQRREDSFAGLCRIEVPYEGADPVSLDLAQSFLSGRWMRPGALSPLLDITCVELTAGDGMLVLLLSTDPPLDDRTFVTIRIARDLRAALRHARRNTPIG